jgi:hypothetical protein
MKVCDDCGMPKSDKGIYCKRCGYKHRTRPSGLVYNIKKANPTWFVKGQTAWNKGEKGRHFSPKTEFKIGVRVSPKTEFKAGQVSLRRGKEYPYFRGANHPNWRGDDVSYGALHCWVRSRFGLPSKCVKCGSNKNVDWANKSGEYKRVSSDWIQLCRKCHLKFDNVIIKGWITRKEKGGQRICLNV